jgi:hypothetical protein
MYKLTRKYYFRVIGILLADTLVIMAMGLYAVLHSFPPGPWPGILCCYCSPSIC